MPNFPSRWTRVRICRATAAALALASAVACRSDEIAGIKPRPDRIAAAVSPTIGFIWGVQGHPARPSAAAYEGSGPGLEKQFDYINSLRARYYRVDVYPDNAGNVDPRFNTVLDRAAARGVKILPVLVRVPDMSLSPAQNYSIGYSIGYNFALRYRGRFTHVEAGNELDNFAIKGSGLAGKLIADYDAARLTRATSLLRGMAIGIHNGAPGTGVIIDANFTHFGFIQALQRDSVPFDVYGWHWYSDMGDFAFQVPANLPDMSKEIWITEANRRNTDASPDNPTDQANVIARYVREFYSIPRVKALFIYELYDERAFLHPPPPQLPDTTEVYYGLVRCTDDGCAGTKTLKLGFDAYRYGIEERLYGYEDYVYSLYVHLNQRTPDGSGLAFWTNRFKGAPTDTLGLINSFAPEESYKVFIKDQFLALLGRAADGSGLTYWNDRMRAGLDRRSVIAELCGSAEFWSLSGATNAGYVDRLYLKVLRTSSSGDPNGRQYWINRLASGTSRIAVAQGFLDSQSYRTLFVQDQYAALLDRTASASDVAGWVTRMQQGMTQETVIRSFLRTPEFGSKAIKSGYDRRG